MIVHLDLTQKIKNRDGSTVDGLTLGGLLFAAIETVSVQPAADRRAATVEPKELRKRRKFARLFESDTKHLEIDENSLDEIVGFAEKVYGAGDTRALMEIYRLTDEAKAESERNEEADREGPQ